MKWILCSEKLPPQHEYVLCKGTYGSKFIGLTTETEVADKVIFKTQHQYNRRFVVKWMPLPE